MKSGPDRIKDGGQHIRVVENGKRTGIHKKSDCTVLRRCNCYILEFGRDFASVGADNTFVFCPRRKH